MSFGKILSQEIIPPKYSNNRDIDLENKIYDSADKNPEYPGGMNAFYKDFSKAFKKGEISGVDNLRADAQFVISKEGYITKIVVSGNNYFLNQEVEKALKTLTGKWTPAEVKGKPVSYKFRLPVKMNIP